MPKIQEKLDSLQPHVVGIRYIQKMQIVDAVFNEGWTVPNSDIIKKELVDESQNYYMFYTEKEGITIDDLLDYVEGIININIEREKKHTLLKSKVKELQKIFNDSTLSKLERLKFSFGEDDIVPSLMDMDIELDEDFEEVAEELVIEEALVETKSRSSKNKNKVGKINTANIKGQTIELPPKDKKIVVEDYEAPTNIVCNCEGPDQVCPVCQEEKIGAY
jgi:hypothetical protein